MEVQINCLAGFCAIGFLWFLATIALGMFNRPQDRIQHPSGKSYPVEPLSYGNLMFYDMPETERSHKPEPAPGRSHPRQPRLPVNDYPRLEPVDPTMSQEEIHATALRFAERTIISAAKTNFRGDLGKAMKEYARREMRSGKWSEAEKANMKAIVREAARWYDDAAGRYRKGERWR